MPGEVLGEDCLLLIVEHNRLYRDRGWDAGTVRDNPRLKHARVFAPIIYLHTRKSARHVRQGSAYVLNGGRKVYELKLHRKYLQS